MDRAWDRFFALSRACVLLPTLIVIPLVALATLAMSPSKASAVCGFQESISDWTNGTTNRFKYRARDVDTCDGARSLSTAHISRQGNCCDGWFDWVEIGWERDRFTGDGSVEKCVFWEKGFNGSSEKGGNCGTPNLVDGNFAAWRVTNVEGSDNWQVLVNWEDGTGFNQKQTYDTTYRDGVASGETERWGGQSGMQDSQQSLDFKNNNNTWVRWPDNNCIVNTSFSFFWHHTANDAYDVNQAVSVC
jgi:hypothetical protein